jgi:hypothetical protein
MKKIMLLFVAALLPLLAGATAADAGGYGYRGFYGPRYFGGYPYFAGYAGTAAYGGCYRWRTVVTPIGPQWRMLNECYVPVVGVPPAPVFYGYRPYYY